MQQVSNPMSWNHTQTFNDVRTGYSLFHCDTMPTSGLGTLYCILCMTISTVMIAFLLVLHAAAYQHTNSVVTLTSVQNTISLFNTIILIPVSLRNTVHRF